MLAPLVALGFLGLPALTQNFTATPPVQAPAVDAEERLRRRFALWQGPLQDAFLPLGGCLMLDLAAETLLGPPPLARPDGADRETYLALMGALFHRKVVPLPHGSAFARSLDTANSALARHAAVLGWLQSVPDAELRALLGPGVAYTSLAPASKALFARLCDNQGLIRSMACGEFIDVHVRLAFFASARDTESKPVSILLDQNADVFPTESARRDRLEATYVPPKKVAIVPTPAPPGELDLTKGELLKLGDLVGRAVTAFGNPVVFDTRLADAYVYAQGRFARDAFLRYVRAVAQPVPWDLAPPVAEYRQAIVAAARRRIPPLLGSDRSLIGIPYSSLLEGRTVRLDDFAGNYPDVGIDLPESIVRSYRLPPNPELTLVPAVAFQLVNHGAFNHIEDRSGDTPLANNWLTTFGRPPIKAAPGG